MSEDFEERVARPAMRTAVRLVASVVARDTGTMHALADEGARGDLSREVLLALAQMNAALLEGAQEATGEPPEAFLAGCLDFRMPGGAGEVC